MIESATTIKTSQNCTELSPSKVTSGVKYTNCEGQTVVGTMSETKVCGQDASQDCIPNASLHAVISTSDINSYDLSSDLSIGDVAGFRIIADNAYPNCSAEGEQNCISTSAFPSIDTASIVASQIITGASVLSINGSYGSNCSAGSQQGCVATASYPSQSSSALTAMDVKAGSTVNAVSGSMKYCKSAADISFVDAPNFATNLPLASFNNRSITPDHTLDTMTASSLIFDSGIPVRLTAATIPTGLAVATTYYSIFIDSATFKLAASYADATAGTPVPINFSDNGSDVKIYSFGDSAITIHDTIDRGNFEQNGVGDIGRLAPDSPYGANFLCTESNWELVAPSPNGTQILAGASSDCDAAGDDCMIRDKLTGLIWSEVKDGTGLNYAAMVKSCNDLVSGNLPNWRLATIKEYLQGYVNGLAVIGQYTHFGSWKGLWSASITSSSAATNLDRGIGIYLDNFWSGGSNGGFKVNATSRYQCVKQGPTGSI
jgi:hypothetical protein